MIPVSVKRGEQTLTLQVPLRFGAAAAKVVEDPSAPARGVRLRNGLLQGTTDRLRAPSRCTTGRELRSRPVVCAQRTNVMCQ
jgi:hypothetical protein